MAEDVDFDALCRQFRDALDADDSTKEALLAKIEACDDEVIFAPERKSPEPKLHQSSGDDMHLDELSDVVPRSSNNIAAPASPARKPATTVTTVVAEAEVAPKLSETTCDDGVIFAPERKSPEPKLHQSSGGMHLDELSDVVPRSSPVRKPATTVVAEAEVAPKWSDEEIRRIFFRAAAAGDVENLRSAVAATGDNGTSLVASVDNFDETALNLAATRNQPAIISELLNKWPALIKEQLERKNAHHYYPILIVAAMGSHECCDVLLECCDVNLAVSTRDGNSPLHLAARQGHEKTFMILLAKAAEDKASLAGLVGPNNHGETVLHLCAEKNLLNGAKQLLKLSKGTSLDTATLLHARDNGNSTACHIAATESHEELAIALVKAGSDANAVNDLGLSILHIAADRGLKMLSAGCIAKGAKLDLETEDFIGSNQALHLAANNGHELVVRFLIAKGAPTDTKNGDNKTAVQLARAAGHVDLAEKIKEGAFAPR
jgi:ankyrin repeat protein